MIDAVDVGAHLIADGPWAGWTSLGEEEHVPFLSVIGPCYSMPTGEGRACVAIDTRAEHGNINGGLHGGLIAGFADHAYVIGLCAMGRREQLGSVTVELTMQFAGAGRIGPRLSADVEMIRETGRLFFMRMLLSQEGQPVASSTAMVRKRKDRTAA